MSSIVFPSSTSRDLPEERAAILEACRALNLGVATMEDFPASGDGATAGSLAHLNKCDVYVGVFARRYGYIEEGFDISVVEAEYNRASQRGLECLCFFLAEDVNWPEDRIERETLPRLEALKKRIQAERIVRWFRNPDHLRYEVFRALLDWLERSGQRPRGPWQIPPPPADFVGRAEELAALLACFEQGATIVGARGLGGVGKTSLALVLAQRLATRFCDGQIYLDLRGVSMNPVSVHGALAHVIRSFQPAEELPADDGLLSGLYRTTLHGRRVLLLMDNAADASQVLPLLPPSGSALLVTSRRRFSVPGLLVRDLDTLPSDDAVALLVGIAPRLKGLAGEIASLCGHLPLALRLAGGLLADRDDLEVNQYIERLRRARLSERSGLTEVTATLQLSEAMLPIPLRTRWHELSLLVGGFEMSWAGAVWQADVDTADYWLGQLRRNSLIEWSESEKWYRLHDLVREYAAVHLDAEQRQLAARRHAAYFRNMMEDADRLYKEGGVGFGEAARVFDRAWANTERALSWAQEHTDNIDLQADSLSSIDLANRIFESLWHLGRYHPARELLLKAIALQDKTLGSHDLRVAITFSNLGDLEWTLGSLEEAKRCYQRAIEIESQHLSPDHPNLAPRYSSLGRVEHDLGNLDAARELFVRAIAIEEGCLSFDHPNLAIRYSNLARVEFDLGSRDEARRLVLQAIDIEERKLHRDHPNLAVRYALLGRIEQELGHSDEARTWLLKAVRIGEMHYGSHAWYFSLFGFSLGELEYELVDTGKGLERARQSYREMCEKLGVMHPRTQRARAWLMRHDVDFTETAT